MLEEINRSVREMEADERQLRSIQERDQRDESTPVEPDRQSTPDSKLDQPDQPDKNSPGTRKATAKAPDPVDVPSRQYSTWPDNNKIDNPPADE
jgi:hypothetical protein